MSRWRWADKKLKDYAARIVQHGEDPDEMPRNDARVRRDFWPKLKRVARHIPFVEDLLAAYFCAMDSSTPARVKGILLAAIAYFILPLDVIPDFILGLGFSDDATVLMTAIMTVRAHISEAHRKKAREALRDLPPLDDGEGKIIEGEIIAEN